jgi:antitoxin component YwqK of YwqJK toxin-antitoxin module
LPRVARPFQGRERALSAIILLCALIAASCSNSNAKKQIEPVYDKTTGKLQLLKYDSNNNGKPDTFSYMDGARVLRIEMDLDEDGKIDRWEYYDDKQKVVKVGFSRANDGKEDAWSFTGPDGTIDRIDYSTNRDGKVTRTEHFEKNALTTAEEDTDEDGKIDKWETYQDGHLTSVAFDTIHRGTPDRRLIYGDGGSARMEVDPDGTGHFVPAPAAPAPKK